MSLRVQHISINQLESLVKSTLITCANDNELKHGTSTSDYRELQQRFSKFRRRRILAVYVPIYYVFPL